MRAFLLLGAVTIVALAIPQTVHAQERRLFAEGALMLSTETGHRQGSSPSLPTTGAGGTAVGATAELGGFLTSRLAIGAQLSLPHRYTTVQETDYSRVFQQQSRHRDLALSGVLHWSVASAGRVKIAAVGGGGVVQESTRQRQREAGSLPTFPPIFGPYSAEYSFTRWTVSGLAGGDGEISISPHIFVVGEIRAHFVRRTDDPSEQGWALGLSSVVWRPAVAVRAKF